MELLPTQLSTYSSPCAALSELDALIFCTHTDSRTWRQRAFDKSYYCMKLLANLFLAVLVTGNCEYGRITQLRRTLPKITSYDWTANGHQLEWTMARNLTTARRVACIAHPHKTNQSKSSQVKTSWPEANLLCVQAKRLEITDHPSCKVTVATRRFLNIHWSYAAE